MYLRRLADAFATKQTESCPRWQRYARLTGMSSIAEIEAAIKNLPKPQVDQLAQWLEAFRHRCATPPSVDSWLEHARGVARPGINTDEVMALTRGEE